MGSLRKNKNKRTTITDPSDAIVDRFLGINSDTIAGRFVGLCSDAVADKNRQRPYRWAYTTLRSNRSNVLCYVAPPHFVAILFKPLGPGGRGLCSDAVADKNRQRPYRWAYTTLRSNRSNVLCYVAPPHFVAILFKPLGPGGRAPVIRESKEGQGHLQVASLCFSCNRRHTYRQRGPILK